VTLKSAQERRRAKRLLERALRFLLLFGRTDLEDERLRLFILPERD